MNRVPHPCRGVCDRVGILTVQSAFSRPAPMSTIFRPYVLERIRIALRNTSLYVYDGAGTTHGSFPFAKVVMEMPRSGGEVNRFNDSIFIVCYQLYTALYLHIA